MIAAISKHVLDILNADVRLFEGGTAFEAGWSGVKRPENGTDQATAGFINLFDCEMEEDAGTHRPAIYLGSRKNQGSDRLDFAACSGTTQRIEHRRFILPLALVTQGETRKLARQQRDQLRANVKQILFDHIIEANFWYELSMPGDAAGGQAREQPWLSATGGGAQGVAEAGVVLPVVIRYTWGKNSPA